MCYFNILWYDLIASYSLLRLVYVKLFSLVCMHWVHIHNHVFKYMCMYIFIL